MCTLLVIKPATYTCLLSIDPCAVLAGALATGADNTPRAGDVITYEATVENTGSTCLRQLALADELEAFRGCQPSDTGKPRHRTT